MLLTTETLVNPSVTGMTIGSFAITITLVTVSYAWKTVNLTIVSPDTNTIVIRTTFITTIDAFRILPLFLRSHKKVG